MILPALATPVKRSRIPIVVADVILNRPDEIAYTGKVLHRICFRVISAETCKTTFRISTIRGFVGFAAFVDQLHHESAPSDRIGEWHLTRPTSNHTGWAERRSQQYATPPQYCLGLLGLHRLEKHVLL